MPSATLSVSGPKLSSCFGVVQAMKSAGLCGDVTDNVSVAPDGSVEIGCRVLVVGPRAETDAKALWATLSQRFALRCAHVRLSDDRAGCTSDVFGESRCPSRAA